MVPWLISAAFLLDDMSDPKNLLWYFYGQSTQAVICHILIFFSWKKGPECWLKIAPHLFYSLAVIAYCIIPLAITLFTHEVWQELGDDPLFMQIFVSLIQQLLMPIQFYLVVQRVMVPDAKAYLDKRERSRLLQ